MQRNTQLLRGVFKMRKIFDILSHFVISSLDIECVESSMNTHRMKTDKSRVH